MDKMTKDKFFAALKGFGESLGLKVVEQNTSASDAANGDSPEAQAIVVQFVQNEAAPAIPENLAALDALVTEFGGVEALKNALASVKAIEVKANADAEAEKTRRAALIKKLAVNMEMDEEELESMSTSAMEKLAGKMMRGNVRMNFAGLAGSPPVKTNQATQQPAPRPSVLLRPPVQATQ